MVLSNPPGWSGFQPIEPRVSGVAPDIRKRRAASEETRLKCEHWVLDKIRTMGHQAWLEGGRDLKIPDEDIQAIQAEIEEEFVGDPRRWAVNFLARGLERGRKQLGWNVNVPGRIMRLKLPSPPIDAEAFVRLEMFDALQAGFIERWKQRPERVLPGDIMASALLFDGIASVSRLTRFAEHVCTLRRQGAYAWVEWQDEAENWDRVILSGVTEALVLRWMPTSPGKPLLADTTRKGVWACLDEVLSLRKAGIPSLGSLIAAITPGWAMNLPPFLFEWSRGRLPSAVLPDHAWYRLLSRQREAHEPRRTSERDAHSAPMPVMATRGDANLQTARASQSGELWIPALRRLITPADSTPLRPPEIRRRLQAFVDQHASETLPALLAQWLLVEIKQRPTKSAGLRRSSAYAFLSRIDRRLAIALDGQSPLALKPAWDSLLESVIESVGPRNRGNVAAALKSFHGYLMRSHDFQPLTNTLAEGSLSLIDANLINEDEFTRVLALLHAHDKRENTFCTVAAILGMRARLRRNETYGLRIQNWIGQADPVLLLFPSKGEKFKTEATKRWIPLSVYCTEEELGVLRAHLLLLKDRARESKCLESQFWFFPAARQEGERELEARLFAPIERALREITGDETLRYHHLRHSGVNRTALRCLHDLLPDAATLLEKSDASVAGDDSMARALMGSSMQVRGRLWAVSATSGHASPDTTMGSYLHLCDWLMFHAATQVQPKFDDAFWASVKDVSITYLRVSRHRQNKDGSHTNISLLKQFPDADTRFAPPGRYAPYATLPAINTLASRRSPWSGLSAIRLLSDLQTARKTKNLSQDASAPGNVAEGLWQSFVAASKMLQQSSRHTPPQPKSTKNPRGLGHVIRPFPLPLIPKSSVEKMQVDRLHEALASLSLRYPRLQAWWLGIYRADRYPRAHSMRLTNPKIGITWLAFLARALERANQGVDPQDSSYLNLRVHFEAAPHAKLAPEAQLPHWQRVVTKSAVWESTRPGSIVAAGMAPHGTLDVWLKSPPSADAKSRGRWQRKGNAALDVAVYVLLCQTSTATGTLGYS